MYEPPSRISSNINAGVERPMTTLYDQPHLIPPPIPSSQLRRPTHHHSASSQEWLLRTRTSLSHASTRTSFSIRRKLNTYNPYNPQSTRRPTIGNPTDSVHLDQGLPPPRRRSFRPLELSIYMPGNNLSPLLPDAENFGLERELQRPPMVHTRSESAMSMFTIPRKAVGTTSRQLSLSTTHRLIGSANTTPESMTEEFHHTSPVVAHPLRPRPSSGNLKMSDVLGAVKVEKALPKRPEVARLRANTMPVLTEQVERVKTAISEKAALDRQLAELESQIAERTSLYSRSRPGSIDPSGAPQLPEPREVPPPLPRKNTPKIGVKGDEEMVRPKTAPSRPTVHIPHRSKSFDEAHSAFSSLSSASPAPPPPLPLFLPCQATAPKKMRKRKSFSRVASWLFPGSAVQQHTREQSMDSVTNDPKPLSKGQGFYQCVDYRPPTHVRKNSDDTVATVSTLDGPATVATSLSGKASRDELARTTTFGKGTFGTEWRHGGISGAGMSASC